MADDLPTEYGGQDRSFMEKLILAEELAYCKAPLMGHFAADLLGPCVLHYGSEEQKKEWLPKMARGEFFAVRKKAFQAANGFDETMPCLEDHELANRLSKLGRFVFISDLTVYESLRRFRKLGFWHVIATWFVDYTSFVFLGKPVSQIWKPIR